MRLRSLVLAVPLAFLVAVLAHLAGFGAEHAPGAGHAHGLLTTLAASLGLMALATVLVAALRLDRRDMAPARQALWLPAILAVGGAAAFAAIELAEGHAPFGGGVRALAAIGPAAALVASLSRFAARMLRRSGEALAAMAASDSVTLSCFTPTRPMRSIAQRTSNLWGSARGRAPPILA